MTLSITNLRREERSALESCDFSQEIIGVKHSLNGEKEIVKLSRDEVSCWQLFLKLFGLGKLAKFDVRLKAVAGHLATYAWKGAQTTDPAYQKVCEIANKALRCKRAKSLFENVSIEKRRVPVSLRQPSYGLSYPPLRMSAEIEIHWNPMLKMKDLSALIRQKISTQIWIFVNRQQNGCILDRESLISKEYFKQLHLEIDYADRYSDGCWPGFTDRNPLFRSDSENCQTEDQNRGHS